MWQFVVSPRSAYRHTAYHKQTKNQWSRDDPAFIVICCGLQAFSVALWCLIFTKSILEALYLVVTSVLVDFVGVGSILATLGWWVSSTYLRRKTHAHAVDQAVEWLYCFDVHCNSWLPAILLLNLVQFLLCPVLLSDGFFPVLLSLILHVTAATYYLWLTFLGYSTLPFLERPRSILWYPILAISGLAVLVILLHVNLTKWTVKWFFKDF